MLFLIYDTETSGLPKNMSCPTLEDRSTYPYIVQLSYILYDSSTNVIVKIFNQVIKIPHHVVMTPRSIELHNITHEIMSEKGIPVETALLEFLNDFELADLVVGHNIHFDINMILIEMLRQSHIFDNEWFQLFKNSNKFYCTMKNSIDLCAIKVPYKNNSTKTYNKFPKLNELYNCLFQKNPNPANLHNALNDVIICLVCFCKMYLSIQVVEINPEINQLLNNII